MKRRIKILMLGLQSRNFQVRKIQSRQRALNILRSHRGSKSGDKQCRQLSSFLLDSKEITSFSLYSSPGSNHRRGSGSVTGRGSVTSSSSTGPHPLSIIDNIPSF
uniref:Uncharacterized protein n=1 Tax=Cacopsylla melanoneura TaxID=428564 RepID=A0A8D8LT23_9HEMI